MQQSAQFAAIELSFAARCVLNRDLLEILQVFAAKLANAYIAQLLKIRLYRMMTLSRNDRIEAIIPNRLDNHIDNPVFHYNYFSRRLAIKVADNRW